MLLKGRVGRVECNPYSQFFSGIFIVGVLFERILPT